MQMQVGLQNADRMVQSADAGRTAKCRQDGAECRFYPTCTIGKTITCTRETWGAFGARVLA